MSMMRKMMIDCETNAMLVTRYFAKDISLKRRMGMFLHTAFCPHCKKYVRQQKLLNERIRAFATANAVANRITSSDKARLQQAIAKNR